MTEVSTHIGSRGAIFFSDLDHLKQINDEFGHKDGDFALENAARIIKETFRSFHSESTICGRIGGDEFVSFILFDDKKNRRQSVRKQFT